MSESSVAAPLYQQKTKHNLNYFLFFSLSLSCPAHVSPFLFKMYLKQSRWSDFTLRLFAPLHLVSLVLISFLHFVVPEVCFAVCLFWQLVIGPPDLPIRFYFGTRILLRYSCHDVTSMLCYFLSLQSTDGSKLHTVL